MFRQVDPREIAAFRSRINFVRPYFLLVGSREQHKGYKNTRLFFDALAMLGRNDFDILCIGGEEEISTEVHDLIPDGVRMVRCVADDSELALAYSGATALVYPSLYEGFGLPVVEAMACGCPVITTTNGSLKEIVDDACAMLVDADSLPKLILALQEVRNESKRRKLVEAGLQRAEKFGWDGIVHELESALLAVSADHKAGAFDEFFGKWRILREIQSSVDIETLI